MFTLFFSDLVDPSLKTPAVIDLDPRSKQEWKACKSLNNEPDSLTSSLNWKCPSLAAGEEAAWSSPFSEDFSSKTVFLDASVQNPFVPYRLKLLLGSLQWCFDSFDLHIREKRGSDLWPTSLWRSRSGLQLRGEELQHLVFSLWSHLSCDVVFFSGKFADVLS